jgi:hypothetical protein
MSDLKQAAALVAINDRWSTLDRPSRTEATAPARRALTGRFANEVDARWPDLDPEERAWRIKRLRSAWYARLQLRQLQAQRARARMASARRSMPVAELAEQLWGPAPRK